jgi:two-component system, LytTR family, sensor kinase
MQVTRSLLDRSYEFLSRRPVYHGLFWVVLFGCLVAVDSERNHDLRGNLINESIRLVFFGLLVYVNLLYLIPRFLARSVLMYLGLVLAACAIVTPLQVFALYVRYSGQFDFQRELVQQQGYLFLFNVLVTLLSSVLRVIMDWWRYQREKQTLLTQNMQSELRFLKSQINPHFLFNTLNNLYALTLKKSDQAPDIVLKLSEIMRYMLYECNEREVLLAKEIHYMHNYLDLERIRQPKDAEITFTTAGHISEQLVAPLLFVPFVENSFKHGLNHQVGGGGFVRMHLAVHDTDLEFTCENSKTAHLPRQNHPRSGGIGLTNVRQRLQLLYPDAYDLEVQDESERYVVTLRLSLDGMVGS